LLLSIRRVLKWSNGIVTVLCHAAAKIRQQ